MARTILADARFELSTTRYGEWARLHTVDDRKVRAELTGDRRTQAGSPYARLLIEAIRVGLDQEAPKPLPSLHELARNVMFTAWAPAAALRCPLHWRVAVSADPAYDAAVRAAAPLIKEHGNLLAVWGNQSQVGAERIRQLGAELGADYLIFQAETVEEYETAIGAGCRLLVGNPNAWTAGQRADATARIERGELAVLFEVYSNAGDPWPNLASAQGVPVSSEVVGVGWGTTPHQLAAYKDKTPTGVWQSMGVYLAEPMTDESWALLP